MPYKNLTPALAIEYVAERTNLFSCGASFRVHEFARNDLDGDGYVNHTYRVSDEYGSSVILKQAKPYIKALGEGVYPLTVERNASEVEIMRLRSTIVPQYVPRVLHADRENNLYICEDWGDLGIARFEFAKGRFFPQFAKQMGEYLGMCNFYTSEMYLDPTTHKMLETRFVSPEMQDIMERILFLRETLTETFDPPQLEPLHQAASDRFWHRREVRVELLKLRDVYMKKRECLVHGDLHTSNILVNANSMIVFDMEYTHMGPYSSDMGYLLGNLVYVYITWFFRETWDDSRRGAFRREMLNCVERLLTAYIETFTECWARDAKAIFRGEPEYLADIHRTYLKEVCGFTGSQIASRVGGCVETPDFEAVENPDRRNAARALAMAVAYNLIMGRGDVASPSDICEIVRTTAEHAWSFC